MIYDNLLDLIGNTPVVKLQFKNEDNIADVYIKLEKFNLGGSVKDRAALGMIEAAERDGLLKEGYTIVEPTSGNTGIALALIGRLKSYNVIITMPDTMSVERRAILKAYGAELILTDGAKGMKGAIEKAEELVKENPTYFLPQQFNNKANPEKHYETTAKEILDDFKDLDVFVAGVGTAGTLSGVGKRLKENFKNVKVVAVEPETSAVLSGEQPGKHVIQGIGAGFIPGNYENDVVDEVIKISNDEALEFSKYLSKEEGLFLGISSGANVAAAYKLAKKLGKGKKVLTISPDGGEKYLFIEAFQRK
ncbi:cysteine synthase A, partial [Fusobacterium nucleatum]|uniref:cysteine synthase A n=1 Tax=Fusobacterium nucleatum TaxID=851 RepID=UPI0011C4262F